MACYAKSTFTTDEKSQERNKSIGLLFTRIIHRLIVQLIMCIKKETFQTDINRRKGA